MAKITINQEKCIGCGTCEVVCPKYWKLNNQNKAEFLGPEELDINNIGCNQEAINGCPVQCIYIEK